MLSWIKTHKSFLISLLVMLGFLVYVYGCTPTAKSLIDDTKKISRQELQLELDTLITMAQLRMADLDKQEALRDIILQNALIIVQGQPFNPFGIITAFAGVYGFMQGGKNITKVVKNNRNKRRTNNGA